MPTALTVDLHLDPGRQRIDHRDADAVEPAGHLVALAPELAPGVEHREHDLGGRELFILVVEADGNSPTII